MLIILILSVYGIMSFICLCLNKDLYVYNTLKGSSVLDFGLVTKYIESQTFKEI